MKNRNAGGIYVRAGIVVLRPNAGRRTDELMLVADLMHVSSPVRQLIVELFPTAFDTRVAFLCFRCCSPDDPGLKSFSSLLSGCLACGERQIVRLDMGASWNCLSTP